AEPVLNHEDGTTTVTGTVIDGAIKSQTIDNYDSATGKQTLKFDLDYEKIMGSQDTRTQAKSVYVYYEAIVQKEAVKEGNHIGENIATLTYSNAATPDSTHTTNKSETDVYNYYLRITKIKGETTESLKGAKFALYLAKDSNTKMRFVKETNTDGSVYYRPAVDGDSEDSIVTDIEADFQIRGLDANTYYLEETETPSGYYKPEGRFEIKLISKMENGKHTGKLDATNSSMKALETADANLLLSPNVDSNLAYEYSAGVKNSSTPNLPTTGGAGTMLLSIGGVVLMAAGAYLIFFRKKEN
ncbi:SpaA isopeptide-forming pilin-related protein, partial [Butyricicoccus sp.]|uniref:SpaA isopeptide-forming pilin-related protein n=1 Tax=Butyricicoccus sp. TaxID=2049021 RepID=UPI003D7ED77F